MGSEASETAWWPSLCDTSPTSVTKRDLFIGVESEDKEASLIDFRRRREWRFLEMTF